MESLARLLQALFAGEDDLAEAAAARLPDLPARDMPALLAALEARLAEPDPELRWWAARALAVLGRTPATAGASPDPAAPDPATPDLASPPLAADAQVEAQVVRLLLRALADPAAEVRQCAALGLRAHPDPACIPALAAQLSDPDPLAARLAADALEAMGAAAAPALIDVLQHGPQPARLHAVRALAAVREPGAVPALFAALNEDSLLLEYWADLGLERLGVGTSFFLPD
ncbi:MAG: HEAT repeat domain-containing protein [Chloroflexota bacterium]